MEIDEDWQTNRRYMRMAKEDRNYDDYEDFVKEINNLNKEETLEEVLVALRILQKNWDSLFF